jgi:hypothetical protein
MQPINYLQQVADPFAETLQGVKIGAGMAELQQQQLVREQQQRQQQLAAQEQARFFSNPNPTMRDAARFASVLTPEQSKAFLPFMEGISKEQQQGTLKSTGQLLSALQTNPQTGIKLMQERAVAARNSGDIEDATLFEQMAEAAADPQRGPGVVFKSLAVRTAGIPGAKEMFETIDKSLGTARAEAQAPATLAEAEAKAIQEGVKAEFARPVAMAELAKTKAETLAPAVRESIDFANLKPEQQATFQALQILKKPPAAVTNVNVSNVDKTAAAELGKLVPDLYNQANSAATQLSDLPRYQAALDSAITGPFAEQRLSTARVASALGFTGDKAVNATREVIQGLSEMALKSRTMLTGQGQITEGEQKLLIKARSGDIDFTKGELKTIFGVADRAAKAQYNQSRKLLESAAKQSPTAQMFLENMQPLAMQEAPQQAPAPAPAQAAPAAAASVPVMPAGFRIVERGR